MSNDPILNILLGCIIGLAVMMLIIHFIPENLIRKWLNFSIKPVDFSDESAII